MFFKKDSEIGKAKVKGCGDPYHLIGEFPKPPKDKNQRAFVGGSWSDSGEEDDEKVKDETCLVAHASSEVSNVRLVPSCFVIYDLELLSLSFDFVFSSEIFKSLSFHLDRLCRLAILCLDQHAHTLHHLESLLTISLDRLDIFEGRSCISEFVRNMSMWLLNPTSNWNKASPSSSLLLNPEIKQLSIKAVWTILALSFSGFDSKEFATGFPAQSVGSSNIDVLDLPCLLVLIIGTSQSRQHDLE
ncbi:hypothetical protein Tco_0152866 [Tanacetum coccineum]